MLSASEIINAASRRSESRPQGRHARTTERRVHMTPNWLKAVYAVLAFLATVITVAVLFAPEGASTPDGSHVVPQCTLEDGSKERVCIFRGSDGADYINFNYGQSYAKLEK